MTKLEIRSLEEILIRIRDQYGMDMYDRDALADAINLITHNEARLSDDEDKTEEVKAKICDDYCRFRVLSLEMHDDPDEAQKYLEHTSCAKCPLNEI